MAYKYNPGAKQAGTTMQAAAPALSAIPLVGPFLGAGAAIGGGIISSGAGDPASEDLKAQMDRLDALHTPEFSNQQIQAEEYQPGLYDAPEAAQYQTINLPDGTRDSQMVALKNLQGYGNGYAGAQADADQNAAIYGGNQLAKSRQGAIEQNAAARGMGGSLLSMIGQEQAGQEGANRAMMGGQQAQATKALRNLQAAGDYSQGLGQVRQQDTQLGAQNADIINRFNMQNTNWRNSINQANTQMKNAAQQYNQANRQDTAKYNLGRQDANSQSMFNNAYQKASGQGNVANSQAQIASNQADKSTAAILSSGQAAGGMLSQGVSQWPKSEPLKDPNTDSNGAPSSKYGWEKWSGQ